MNKNRVVFAIGFFGCFCAALAAKGEGSRWTFSAGPAWRSGVKMETSGRVSDAYLPASSSRSWDKDLDQSPSALGVSERKLDPQAGITVPAGQERWAATATRTDVTVSPGTSDGSVNASDTERPLGLTLQGGYDFYRAETFSVGVGLRFAGYWNMRSESSGRFSAGDIRTQTFKDYFLYEDRPYTGNVGTDLKSWNRPSDTPVYDYAEPLSDTTVAGAGTRSFTTRLRSDLYQIGLGPKITWTPFAGVCEWMDWLDVYGGVEILCNIAYSKLEADGASGTSTDCRIGFGGNVGLTGNITDWLGIYGQVGYEWVDKTSVSAGSFSADIDYSSLVLSAGVQFRF